MIDQYCISSHRWYFRISMDLVINQLFSYFINNDFQTFIFCQKISFVQSRPWYKLNHALLGCKQGLQVQGLKVYEYFFKRVSSIYLSRGQTFGFSIFSLCLAHFIYCCFLYLRAPHSNRSLASQFKIGRPLKISCVELRCRERGIDFMR